MTHWGTSPRAHIIAGKGISLAGWQPVGNTAGATVEHAKLDVAYEAYYNDISPRQKENMSLALPGLRGAIRSPRIE